MISVSLDSKKYGYGESRGDSDSRNTHGGRLLGCKGKVALACATAGARGWSTGHRRDTVIRDRHLRRGYRVRGAATENASGATVSAGAGDGYRREGKTRCYRAVHGQKWCKIHTRTHMSSSAAREECVLCQGCRGPGLPSEERLSPTEQGGRDAGMDARADPGSSAMGCHESAAGRRRRKRNDKTRSRLKTGYTGVS